MTPATASELTVDLCDTPKTENAYASPSWWYDLRGFFILKLAYRDSLWRQVFFFDKNISDNHLEVAVGSGTLLRMILFVRQLRRRPIGRIVGIDYAKEMLAGALRTFRRWANIELEQADARALRFADASFDSVNIANALHSIPDPDVALGEAHRVLKVGGRLAVNALLHPRGSWPLRNIAAAIDAWGIRKGILVSPFDGEEISALFRRTGFRIEERRNHGNALYLVARK